MKTIWSISPVDGVSIEDNDGNCIFTACEPSDFTHKELKLLAKQIVASLNAVDKIKEAHKEAQAEYKSMEDNLDMPEGELMYSEGEMNAFARVLLMLEVKS